VRAPLLVGIAGGTGSGKTTIARRLAGELPPGSVTLLEHDSYYRDRHDLTAEERDALNFDHPDALETDLLVEHLTRLKGGSPSEIPIYDFATHRRKRETHRVEPTPVIILEGILVFVDPRLCELLDIKLFVETEADIRVLRRIKRDIEQRGRSFESVREQYYETVRPMHLAYVEPSKRFADMILPEGGNLEVALDLILAKLKSVL
jgi:uridine kinase